MINKNKYFFSSITRRDERSYIIQDHELKPIRPKPEDLTGEILTTYGVKLAKIYIVKERGGVRYIIEEPPIEPEVQHQIVKLIEYIYTTRGVNSLLNPKSRAKVITKAAYELNIQDLMEKKLGIIDYYIDRVLSGYGILYPIINDPYVEEIACERPYCNVAVFHRLYPDYLWLDTNISLSENELNSLVLTLARKARVHVSTAFPYAEGLTEEGHRIAITYLREVSPHGSSFVIRKFPQIPLTIIDLVNSNTLSPLEAAYLWTLIENQAFIMIIGGIASGKSVGKLSHMLIRQGGNIRLVTIEGLWNNLVARGYEAKKLGNMEVIENPDIEILTVTEKGIEWHKPKYLIRHRYVGKIYHIRTKTGRMIEVTPDHSLVVWKVGTEKDKFKITFESVNPGSIGRKTYLPYLRLLELHNHSQGSGKSTDPRFGYLVGFFVAEGYFNGSTPRLYQSTGPILDHVIKYMNELGFQYRISPEKRKPHMRYIAIYDGEYKREITLNKVGPKARTKRVPDIFWNMDEEWRLAFLAGIIDGGGSIHTGKYIIVIATASVELAYGLLYAFASVGVHVYLRTKRVKKHPDHVYYRIFIPVSINKEPLRKIMKWLSEEKRQMIEEAIEKSTNHHSDIDIIPAEIAYAIGSMLKRKEHRRDTRLSFELRSYKYKGENPSFYRVEELLGEKLYEFIPRGVGFDEIVRVEEEEYEGYVYDIEIPETENFEVNGIFVHNTTMLQALLNLIPINSRIVTIEDTPELRLMHPHWDSLITRHTYSIAPKGLEVTLFDLAKFALRRRAEYIVIGEVRGEEARVLAQAAATGQGSMCLEYSDKILIKDNTNTIKVHKIGELVHELIYTEIHNPIRVLSFDLKGLKPTWKPIMRVYKTLTTSWILIETNEGRKLKYTPNHPLPIISEGRLTTKKAKSIRAGDKLLTLNKDVSDDTSLHDVRIATDEVIAISEVKLNTPEWAYDIEVKDTHTFIHSTSVITHNCTFHADSVESALIRLRSPPIELSEGFLNLIWCFVIMKRVKLKQGGYTRRVTEIVELIPTPQGPSKKVIFTWDPRGDKHIPLTINEVIDKSYRLKQIASLKGIDLSELENELKAKERFIINLMNKGTRSLEEVFNAIMEFYMRASKEVLT